MAQKNKWHKTMKYESEDKKNWEKKKLNLEKHNNNEKAIKQNKTWAQTRQFDKI